MIHPRTLNGETFGNGVRYRVSACRKRLRVSRSTHRVNKNPPLDEQSKEIESPSTLSHDNHGVVFATSGAQEEAEST